METINVLKMGARVSHNFQLKNKSHRVRCLTGPAATGIQCGTAEVLEPGSTEDQLHSGRGRRSKEGGPHPVRRQQGDSTEATTTAAATVVGPATAAETICSSRPTGPGMVSVGPEL